MICSIPRCTDRDGGGGDGVQWLQCKFAALEAMSTKVHRRGKGKWLYPLGDDIYQGLGGQS